MAVEQDLEFNAHSDYDSSLHFQSKSGLTRLDRRGHVPVPPVGVLMDRSMLPNGT